VTSDYGTIVIPPCVIFVVLHGMIRDPSLKHYVKAWIFGSSPKMTGGGENHYPLPISSIPLFAIDNSK